MKIIVQCAWCKKVMGTKEWEQTGRNFCRITHSVCPACASIIREEIRVHVQPTAEPFPHP